jgi:4-hydroxy-tetrahydrodipicolinate synthase
MTVAYNAKLRREKGRLQVTKKFPFTGVGAAMVTLYDERNAIDMTAMARFGRWLMDQGCDGLLVFGTTGEGPSLSIAERLATLKAMIAAGIPAERIICGTGSAALDDVATLTGGVGELGCHALVLPPFFFRQASAEGVHQFFNDLLARTSGAKTSVLLYHFPDASGVTLKPDSLAELMRDHPGRITGIKDSSGNLESACAWTEWFPELAVFAGDDHIMRPLLEVGGAGILTATTGLAPALAKEVFSNSRREDMLNRLWLDVVLAVPVTEAVKLVFADVSGDKRWLRMRPPLRPLDANTAKTTLDRFRAIDDGSIAAAIRAMPQIFG